MHCARNMPSYGKSLTTVSAATRLQDKVDELDKEMVCESKLQDQLELAQHERSPPGHVSSRYRMSCATRKKKDLLQSRHDALTTESQSLQKELRKAQATVKELEANLKDEQRHALDNERAFRSQGKDEIERLTDDIDDIRRNSKVRKASLQPDKIIGRVYDESRVSA
jgi:vacuolar-type H+-ATPase subunit I/STV1